MSRDTYLSLIIKLKLVFGTLPNIKFTTYGSTMIHNGKGSTIFNNCLHVE